MSEAIFVGDGALFVGGKLDGERVPGACGAYFVTTEETYKRMPIPHEIRCHQHRQHSAANIEECQCGPRWYYVLHR